MKKAFWIFQISNLLSLLFFTVIILNYIVPSTMIWIKDYMYLYFAVIIIVIYSRKWALRFDPNAENPMTIIPICKYLQYIGIGSFLLFAVLRIFGSENLLIIGAGFSLTCMIVAYLLSFILKTTKEKDASLIDNIDFE